MTTSPKFDWKTAPLDEAQSRLTDLSKLCDKARSIVASRQNPDRPVLHCWSQSHLDDGIVPASVLAECRDVIPEGRWVFRDDGAHAEDGTRISILCCSQRCYLVYQKYALDQKLKRQPNEAL